MSEKTISTIEELEEKLRENVSLKRYQHSIGVAMTTERVLQHYNCTEYEKEWNGFSAGTFCGIAHDFAREMTDNQILDYCGQNKIVLSDEETKSPVLAHGKVSAHIVREIVGDYPKSWQKAIDVHTTGEEGMDDLALALFIADYIEPSRKFLDDAKREKYLSGKNIYECEYMILCDMIEHWKQKGYHGASEGSLRLLAELKKRLGK